MKRELEKVQADIAAAKSAAATAAKQHAALERENDALKAKVNRLRECAP